MQELLTSIETPQRKAKLPQIRPGDTVRVHQTIREGGKKRTQIFEGVVIRLSRPNELAARIVVRKIASGVGVEKSWMLHSPNVTKIEVVKRTKVRRAYLTYLRARRGKSARLSELGFDRAIANESDIRTQLQIDEDDAKETKAKVAAKAEVKAADIAGQDEIESVEVIESTDDLAREEDKAAAGADPANDADEAATSGGADEDDAQIAAKEVQEGLDRTDDQDDRDQAKE